MNSLSVYSPRNIYILLCYYTLCKEEGRKKMENSNWKTAIQYKPCQKNILDTRELTLKNTVVLAIAIFRKTQMKRVGVQDITDTNMEGSSSENGEKSTEQGKMHCFLGRLKQEKRRSNYE
ncbi:MAG: hypothetical protein AB1779_07235 [Candidatus Thermoplasmatota archaeon]